MPHLIDISALAACFKEYGPHPLHYIYRLIMPAENTAYNLLGNTVNTMFDAEVTRSAQGEAAAPAPMQQILQQAWHDDALHFLTTDDDSLNRRYFQVIGEQYQHVRQVIGKDFPAQHIQPETAWLEPSFVCPELGLSGRMDLLDLSGSKANIVELKSGKMNEWEHHAKQAHRVQTMLYAAVLSRCLSIPPERISSFLHYNTYPLLIPQAFPEELFSQAEELRQQILSIMHELAEGRGRQYFTRRTVEAMYPQLRSKLWVSHELPRLLEFVGTIEDAREEVRDWFFSRLQFIMREEELRAGQPEAVSLRGLPLLDLCLDADGGVTGLRLQLDEAGEHDFRTGDPVLAYPMTRPDTQASDSILLRGNISEIDDHQLVVSLRHAERLCHFPPPGALAEQPALYAVEHDTVNSSVSQACRSLYHTLLHGGPSLPHCRLIVGPPGTGKTSVTLRNLIAHLAHDTQQCVLLLAFTHRAVDEICETLDAALADASALAEAPASASPYLRLGTPTDTPPAYHPHLLQHAIDQCKDRNALREVINRTRFWVGTTARLQATRQLFDLVSFDTIIVDEASQLLDFQVIDLLQQASVETILIGDPKQLPAVTLQEGAQSLFEQLYRQGTPAQLLDHQGRMHPDIAQLSNQLFYGNLIQPVGLPHQLEQSAVLPRLWFFDVPSPALGTKANPLEANMVARIVRRIAEIYAANAWEWTEKTLGIIVPYRQQIAAIRNLIDINTPLSTLHTPHSSLPSPLSSLSSLINIDTVERYQGSQRDIIIYTTTVSTPEQLAQLSAPISLDGQLIDRKLNVAITRARKHLFIVGNRSLLCQSSVYQDLLSLIDDKMSASH